MGPCGTRFGPNGESGDKNRNAAMPSATTTPPTTGISFLNPFSLLPLGPPDGVGGKGATAGSPAIGLVNGAAPVGVCPGAPGTGAGVAAGSGAAGVTAGVTGCTGGMSPGLPCCGSGCGAA